MDLSSSSIATRSRAESEASFIMVGSEQSPNLGASTWQELERPGRVESGDDVETSEAVREQPSTTAPAVQHPVAHRIPPQRQTFAHAWSGTGDGDKITIHGRHFVDTHGRVCHLRGVNLSGNCKTPTNHDHDTFPANHDAVTFVGRPFPLEEAPEHFARLRRWGLTFIRFLVTWEAVEHAGPGIYDHEYLDYVRALLSLLPQFGLCAFVVMHQDVWSRYSGGSGAPAWTLEAVGFDLHGLEEPGAAWLKGVRGGGHTEDERGLWPCGYQKLAAATMATCFWAGNTFAPKLQVERGGTMTGIETFLQEAFLNMWEVVAKAVGDLDGVVGFEMINEPHRGYVELKSMNAFDYNTDLHLGHVPTAFQSFMLGAGHPTEVGFWTRWFPVPTRLTSKNVLNTARQKAWREDGPTQGQCLWEMHGVWGWDIKKDEGVVLRESYFTKRPMTGQKVDWYVDYYFPFAKRWADRVQSVTSADKLVLLEPIPNEFCPDSWTPEIQPSNMVYAPHWYDLNTLFTKTYSDFTANVQGLSRGMFPLKAFYWGHQGARDNFALQIRNIVESGYRSLGEKPVIIGECGIPMDMNKGEAFVTDRWTWQTRMMDAMITALERSLVGFTLWTYNPDNDDHIGDDWNGENFSWFSRKRGLPASWLDFEQTSPTLDNGARILRAIVRPYPARTAGIPLRFEYEMNSGAFTFSWTIPDPNAEPVAPTTALVEKPPLAGHPVLTSKDTEIFLPSMLAHDRQVIVKGLRENDRYRYDEARQTLTITAADLVPGAVHQIEVSLKPPIKAAFEVNSFWDDFGGHIIAILVLVGSIFAYSIASRIMA
ncbi:glycoside hydrolase family 5 protein [Wolfiporia cocos MD-104 SS10]|uniref:Glycoside hydrolase family 5 protein n=1 Tax=Wolfiporia cocos (strain MD-104) TaxID=742152 RepID=A0A2H3JJU3_WOLCO|nr:glycoside hydrolase family 5 protein [Wolfiporia cocos MD-104 SS10]